MNVTDKVINLLIDGREVTARQGMSVLEAARDAGIEIPHLCHLPGKDDSKRPCLLCLVEIDGEYVRACRTEATDGMVVVTKDPKILEQRRRNLEKLISHHYGDCKAPCNLTCPGGINVQGYINLIARGEYEAALRLIKEKNPLPLSVGRVCPRFCETRCRRVLLDEPISINHLKRFVADYVQAKGGLKERPGESTGKRAAIIGGGPAGLSCAYFLRKLGHDVTIFEAEKELGGLLRYGIPNYKLPTKVVEQEVQNILDLGVHVKVGRRWGDDFTLSDLKDQGFDSIFIAVGLSKQRSLSIKGGEFAVDGLELLKKINLGRQISLGSKVLVIGGGDVAVDAARSARRLGVRDVTVVYERSRVEMPAQQRDVEEAEKEGVQLFLMATPLSIERMDNGKVKVIMARTVLGEPDERGRRFPVPMPGSRLVWEGDAVISALGQEGDDTISTFGDLEAKLKLSPKKTIKSNPSTMATNIPGIFAGGDCASGPRTVIQAVAAGRRAAEAMHEYMVGEKTGISEPRFNFTKGKRFEDVDMHNYDGFTVSLAQSMPERPPERRICDFFEVELGLTEEMARREAARCLQCGCLGLSKCTFRTLCADHDLGVKKALKRLHYPLDKTHPAILIDPNKCVLCHRCEQTCESDALRLDYIEEDGCVRDKSIVINSNCVSCGACVDTCPTGALTKKDLGVPLLPGEADVTKSVCTYCGTGCKIEIHSKCGVIVEIKSDPRDAPNYGDLCVKGRFGFDFYRHPDRLTRPMIRESREDKFRKVSWEEAIDFAAKRLMEIRQKYGPNAIGVVSSSRCENEVNYLAQKFARAVIGTNNIDNCARVCHAPSVTGLRIALGSGAATNSLRDIMEAEVLIVCGSNTSEAHPVVGMMIRRAVANGTRLIVIDPRRTDLVSIADYWLRLRPGTNVSLFNSMLHVIFDEHLEDSEFIAERTEGFEKVRQHVKMFPPEMTDAITGVSAELLREATRCYAGTRKGMILYGLGVTEHRDGTNSVMGLANLALATGNVGRPGAGILPLRGQNNVQGACDMGALPMVYPGYQDVDDVQTREKFAKEWGTSVPEGPGLTEHEMYQAAREGMFKALYCIGDDPMHTQANISAVRTALASMELVIVQDIFPTETMKMAHVVFPAACFYEKDGTFTNAERRIQRIRKAVEPPGEALPDWKIVCLLAQKMGYSMSYTDPAEIMEEIAKVTPVMAGVHYWRLEGDGLVWPCPHDTHPGTPLLHSNAFTRGKGLFSVLFHSGSMEQPDSEYPLVLITGRRLPHYNNGSMTRRSRVLNTISPEEYVEIHPEDARRFGIMDGAMTWVESRRGKVAVRARLTAKSRPGTVFMAFHFQDVLTNLLTSPAYDEISLTPEYKACAVKIYMAETDKT
ncbi:Formate dehydrogenase [Dissulfuribacter thermophilus]|uniref:Formate dehydrogenase n=1 Tax=Dissulfuribacter thermophilus TaxID=1156395 RepID=A0A1B9F3T2_9BACT|nr:formate dehydrogenase subunit alpha [Dissulfuribacter thermophilus]OCC14494.1 Formate dehydrogenase [Dissulfuribacter thermophilus]